MDINEILVGIDKTEIESPFGWWENSVGAEFGNKRLEEIKEAVQELTEAAYQRGLNEGRREGFVALLSAVESLAEAQLEILINLNSKNELR